MEPDDIPVHDLLGVGNEAVPGPDPLRAIVARAGRRRMRMAAGGMAVALAVGGVVGYAVSNHSSSPAQTATSPSAASSSGPTGNASQPGAGVSSSNSSSGQALAAPFRAPRLTRLFTRTAGPVTIRGFLGSASPIGALLRCQQSGSNFQAEVSTPNMVGIVSGGFVEAPSGTTITSLQSQVVGTAEGDPTAVVTAATTAAVTNVRVAFTGGGTDQMAPVKGWVALAGPFKSAPSGSSSSKLAAPVAVGELTAFNAAGHQVAKMTVTNGFQLREGGAISSPNGTTRVFAAPPIACGVPACPPLPLGTLKGGPVPTTVINPASPPVNSGGASSSGGAVSGGLHACPLHPMPAAGATSGVFGSSGAGSSTGSASSSGG